MKHITKSPEETKELAAELVRALDVKEKALVIALNGDLGSGKTTFSQCIGEALGVRDAITSPTFLIEKIYELYRLPWKHLVHIDAYRLESPKELLHLGWEEIISKPENLVLVEWAEKIEEILPPDTIQVHFHVVDETTREIEING